MRWRNFIKRAKEKWKTFFNKSEDEERKVRLRSTEERKWSYRLFVFFISLSVHTP